MFVENEKDWDKYRGMAPAFVKQARAKQAEAARAERQAQAEAARQAKVEMSNARMAEIKRERATALAERRKADLEKEIARLKDEADRQRAIILQRQAYLESDAAQFRDARLVRTTFRAVMNTAMRTFDVTRSELVGDGRQDRVVFARHFVMYWARRLTGMSYPHIGRLLGGRDHTTIMYGARAYVARRAKMGRSIRRQR